ncbi:MAG: Xaa-Pro peptidase family protein [Gemmatimonadetes bacterium]|nr:Xaa-Pro peptidase family protein [Gemmatimonadota bacterium]
MPTELLEARRQRVLAELDGAAAVFGADRLRDIEGDYPQDSDFRQDNDFFYLTGLEEPEAWLVLNGDRPGAVTLYLQPRQPEQEVWTGVRLDLDQAADISGVRDVRPVGRLTQDLRALDAADEPVVVSWGDPRNAAALGDLVGERTKPAGPLMARLRLVKDADEIARLRRAIDITLEAQREAWRLTRPGLHEYELEAAIEYVFRAQGAERVGFPSIVASGPHTTTLHYDKNRRQVRAGDLVLADVGAEFGYYTADITRTFPASGEFTPRQRAVYELVLGAQEAGLEAVRPGNTIQDVQAAARAYMERNSGDLCGAYACTRYFIHGVSHWLGMDVHDVGAIMTPFEPGMVLSVEPGIYLADEALGVRIEDDVLVTEEGHELLSGFLPRESEAIEAVMREDPRWVQNR